MVVGGGWMGLSVGGGNPHACMHAHMCTHIHVKHGCLHGGGHLQSPNMLILVLCMCAWMHMHVHMSGDTPTSPDVHTHLTTLPEP